MKTWQKLGLIASLVGASFGLFNQANQANAQNIQNKRIRMVDTILYQVDSLKQYSGIPNLKFNINGAELRTDAQGYVDIVTKVNEEEQISNKDFLNVALQGGNLRFNYAGEASLTIYDLLGREVKTFNNYDNNITWDFTNNYHEKIANGFYLYALKKQDKIEHGSLITMFNQGLPYVYLKQKRKDNQGTRSSSSLSKASNLESLLSQSLSITDEDSLSVDGVTGLGKYFDVEASYASLDSIPDVIHMIPNLSFDSEQYRNILHFLKYMTRSDGGSAGNVILPRFNFPIKHFHNKATAPNQDYIAAVDSAVSQDHNNSWESMTVFNHKDYSLSALNLFEEVVADPDTGSTMDYTSTLSHVIFDRWAPYPGPPLHAIVYVDNSTTNNLRIIRETKHELGHVLFSSARHSTDTSHNIQSGQYISKDEGKTIRIIYSLPDLQDMSIYKED